MPRAWGGPERQVKKAIEGPERLRAGRAGGVRRGSGHQAHVPAVGLRIKRRKKAAYAAFFMAGATATWSEISVSPLQSMEIRGIMSKNAMSVISGGDLCYFPA